MEIRANYILIGFFSLACMLGILFGILKLSSAPTDQNVDKYLIHFKDSVSGLSIGNAVLFSGIKVGQVKEITISETEPGAVAVLIEVRGDTPVREDSIANLEMMGLTGASAVAISGGSAKSPLSRVPYGQVGEIHSKPSPLKAVMDSAPNTLSMINDVLLNLEDISGKENKEAVAATLNSIAAITTALAGEKNNLATMVREGGEAMTELNKLLKSANKVMGTLNASVSTLAPELRKLSADSMPQLRALITEARIMVQVMTRLGQKIDSDPGHFIFGNPIKEYELQ